MTGHRVADFDEQTWDGAMRSAHAAIVASERLYEKITPAEGRSTIDIDKHLRRSEVKAAQAQVWVALARELAAEGNRYGQLGQRPTLVQRQESPALASAGSA
jgi:hypothetical protein